MTFYTYGHTGTVHFEITELTYAATTCHWPLTGYDGWTQTVPLFKPVPKNWRWFDVFREAVEPVALRLAAILRPLPHRCQQLVDRADVAHRKRRAWLQAIAAGRG